jgi:Ser/Thr protein kinase RdoA (MazF antagonist)
MNEPLDDEAGIETSPAIEPVMAHYDSVRTSRVTALGHAGGFSGACFWRLETAAGPLCLRAWPPEHPSFERLRWIHGLLAHVWRQGFREVPVPLCDRRGNTLVRHGDRYWELAPWLPGKADYRQHPSRARLASAMKALARFHVAAESFNGALGSGALDCAGVPQPTARPAFGGAPALLERKQLVSDFLGEHAERIGQALRPELWPELYHRARRVAELFPRVARRIQRELEDAAGVVVALQPCLRDVHDQHVLFTGEAVSGLIDFGASRQECVAADLARLLGSCVGDDRPAWREALDDYRRLRTLSREEEGLVPVYDRSGVLLGPMLWLRWIYCEGRFSWRPAAALARIDEGLARLERLAAGE